MSKLIFDDGIRKQVAHADGEGGLVVETIQDVTSIVEANKAEYNALDYGARWGDFTKVASIPMTVVDDLNKKGIMKGYEDGTFKPTQPVTREELASVALRLWQL